MATKPKEPRVKKVNTQYQLPADLAKQVKHISVDDDVSISVTAERLLRKAIRLRESRPFSPEAPAS